MKIAPLLVPDLYFQAQLRRLCLRSKVYEWQQNPAYLRRPALVPNLHSHRIWSKLAPDLPTYRYKQRINRW